ncbi:MAG: fibrobacter succinogenes major paralogous domain-containing protein [Phycisphaerales bacterium]|nr:MAG: fibrobacter succinogenes major paralogous domain-containing protein [Phycisphaerales bacterium]
MKRQRYNHLTVIPFTALGILSLLATGSIRMDDAKSGDSSGPPAINNVTDYDGNSCRTVRIGTQVWMAENLKVTRYRDGTAIPNVSDNDEWPQGTDGAYCLDEKDPQGYKDTYGALYNFHAVSNSRGLCPQGWHVPSESECMTLINHLGGKDVAGGKIKDNSSKLWKTENTLATNESGFSGLPGGGRGRFGSIGEVGYYATWWSSTSYDASFAWHWGLYPDKPGIRSNPGHKASGFSVRCIKD